MSCSTSTKVKGLTPIAGNSRLVLAVLRHAAAFKSLAELELPEATGEEEEGKWVPTQSWVLSFSLN